jgi:hypothetical protein
MVFGSNKLGTSLTGDIDPSPQLGLIAREQHELERGRHKNSMWVKWAPLTMIELANTPKIR